MPVQFITNEQGEKTAVIIPISEYETLLHQRHLSLELTDDYKQMMDQMLDEEAPGKAQYLSYQNVRNQFMRK